MKIFALYGVKASTLEEARKYVAPLLNLVPQARFSDHYEDYYHFGPIAGGEDAELIGAIARDREDVFPVEPKYPGWNFYLRLNDAAESSPNLKSLESDPEHVVKLWVKTYP